MTSPSEIAWTPVVVEGRALEWCWMPSKMGERPAGWPAHKASPLRSKPVVIVMVRKVGRETGPAIVYPKGTEPTEKHAVEVARRFWDNLA